MATLDFLFFVVSFSFFLRQFMRQTYTRRDEIMWLNEEEESVNCHDFFAAQFVSLGFSIFSYCIVCLI